MIQFFILLFGSKSLRQHWWALFLFGLFWMALGLFILADALMGDTRIPPAVFTVPLILDGLWSFASARNRSGGARSLRLGKSCVCLGVTLLIFTIPQHSGLAIGILIGIFLCADASWRSFSAFVLRHARWKSGFVFALVEFANGVWCFVPWPTYWQGEIGADVGTLLAFSAAGVCGLALRIKRLRPGMPALSAMHRGWPEASGPDQEADLDEEEREDIVVHVWTPTETLVPVHRGISRYVAARDKQGMISTGHVALELPPDVYISHYPAVEVDRDGLGLEALRTTAENDLAGRFLPSYADESDEWMPSTFQVRLPGLNGAAIRCFWQSYRLDSTYNLTSRNCASVVAKALDAGLDGFWAQTGRGFFGLLCHFFLTSEVWIAGFMRLRADAMTWTPGLILDYARAISSVIALPQKRQGRTEEKNA